MKVSDFTYNLPDERIAIHPPAVRGTSRLLSLNKDSGKIEHGLYSDIVEYLNSGDVLVLNNTKVIKARLIAENQKGQKRELLLLEDHHTIDAYRRKVLYRGKIHEHEILHVGNVPVCIDQILDGGMAIVSSEQAILDIAENTGSVPLPPYMHRKASKQDTLRYQTVFAKEVGSVAAPTASLNFTHELEQKLKTKGIQIVYLTLHVGLGTFLPIRSDNIEAHDMHSEYFEIPKETIKIIQKSKLNSGKIVALGTTVARTLEFAHKEILEQKPANISGEANIFIYPGYEFKVVDSLITNFHAPKSTVLMLAAAFAGWDNLERAYKDAIQEKYAFLSYGDSMLIY